MNLNALRLSLVLLILLQVAPMRFINQRCFADDEDFGPEIIKLQSCPAKEVALGKKMLRKWKANKKGYVNMDSCPVKKIKVNNKKDFYESTRLEMCCLMPSMKYSVKTSQGGELKSQTVHDLLLTRDPSVIPYMVEALDNDLSPDVRMSAAIGLGLMCSNGVNAALARHLNDKYKYVSFSSALSLVKCGEKKKPLKMLVEVAQGEYVAAVAPEYNNEARRRALFALSSINNKVANDTLINILDNNSKPGQIRCYAAEALGFTGNKKAVAHLKKALIETPDNQEYHMPLCASKALSMLGEYDISLPILTNIAKDGNYSTYDRETAIKQLANSERIDVMATLESLMKDPNMAIQKEASSQIEKLKKNEARNKRERKRKKR